MILALVVAGILIFFTGFFLGAKQYYKIILGKLDTCSIIELKNDYYKLSKVEFKEVEK